MDVTANEIAEWARASIRSLAQHPEYRTMAAVYRELAAGSGLSESLIAKFFDGRKPNPTSDTLDRLVAAIKTAMRKAAA